jgi:hypothetical protein
LSFADIGSMETVHHSIFHYAGPFLFRVAALLVLLMAVMIMSGGSSGGQLEARCCQNAMLRSAVGFKARN